MADLSQYNVTFSDWRRQLRRNDRRTRIVIIIFVAIYVCVGLLVDVYLNSKGNYVPLRIIVKELLTFQIIPYAAIIAGIVAVISLLITYSFADKLMLLGTEYFEITPTTARSVQEKQLYNVIEEMKVAAGLKFMPKVYIIEADYMNAFASGYSEKSAMVAITRGLMQKLNRSEMQAVMAHELSHIRHHDIKLTLTASVLSNLILMVIDLLFFNVVFGSRNDRKSDGTLVLIIVILRYALPIITVLLMLYLSRTREYMADAGCVELMRDNTPLANALLKIHEDHLQNKEVYSQEYAQTPNENVRRQAYLYDPVQSGVEPVASISDLFSTHPDINHRLAALGVTARVKE